MRRDKEMEIGKTPEPRSSDRRRFLAMGAAAGIAGVSAATLSGKPASAQGAEVHKWRLQSHASPTSLAYSGPLTNFVNRVREASGGRLDIQLFSAGAIIPSREIVNGVARGIIEMGSSSAAYSSGIMPVVDTTLVPRGPRNPMDCVAAWETGLGDILRRAYSEHGARLLTMQLGSPIPLYSTKPVRTADDFKGLKIRTHGSTAQLIERLGASTVFIPGEEVYTALQTGVIDAATWGGLATTISQKWYEVAKYIIMPPLVPIFQADDLVVNPDAFDALSPDLQAILQSAADILMWENGTAGAIADGAALGEMKAAGNEVITLDDDAVASMDKAAESVWDALAKRDDKSHAAMKIITDVLRANGYTTYNLA